MNYVFQVTQADFQEKVIEASAEKPVVVDFWAPWCSPCRILGPILERVILSYEGKVLLAKVNIEENRDLAVKWAIQSIPIVKIFREGGVQGEFIGALPESKIRSILKGYIPSQADELALQGNRLLDKGATQAAEATYYQVLQIDPRHTDALLHLANISLEKGEWEKAREFARAIDPGEKHHEAAKKILAQIEFLETCKKITKKPLISSFSSWKKTGNSKIKPHIVRFLKSFPSSVKNPSISTNTVPAFL